MACPTLICLLLFSLQDIVWVHLVLRMTGLPSHSGFIIDHIEPHKMGFSLAVLAFSLWFRHDDPRLLWQQAGVNHLMPVVFSHDLEFRPGLSQCGLSVRASEPEILGARLTLDAQDAAF